MLEYIERSHFLIGTDHRIKIMDLDKEKPINATLEIKGKDDLKMLISENNNNPYSLKERLNKLVDGKEIMIQNEPLKVNVRRASAAIIKNAYIILFAKFGYSFMLDKQYDKIREQIMNPEPYILPDGLWTMQKNLDLFDNVYLSGDNHYRGFFIAYTVMRRQLYRFLVFIPTPLVYYEEAAAIFRNIERGDRLSLMRINNTDFLGNKEEAKDWLYKTYKERSKLKNNFEGIIDTQIQNTFLMEYYLAIIDYYNYMDSLNKKYNLNSMKAYLDEMSKDKKENAYLRRIALFYEKEMGNK